MVLVFAFSNNSKNQKLLLMQNNYHLYQLFYKNVQNFYTKRLIYKLLLIIRTSCFVENLVYL